LQIVRSIGEAFRGLKNSKIKNSNENHQPEIQCRDDLQIVRSIGEAFRGLKNSMIQNSNENHQPEIQCRDDLQSSVPLRKHFED